MSPSTRPNTSTAVMQRRIEPHDSLDYFPTQPWATRAACRFLENELGEVLADQTVWEPACGEMHMARPLAESFGHVRASDVFRYSQDHAICDFLMAGQGWEPVDWVITNPPFMLAERFIAEAKRHAKRGVVMFVRSAFDEGAERYRAIFRHDPPHYVAVYVERVVLLRGRLIRAGCPDPFNLDPETQQPRKASTATSYALFIWLTDTDEPADTRHRWTFTSPRWVFVNLPPREPGEPNKPPGHIFMNLRHKTTGVVHKTTGQDNWSYRPGYQNTPRIEGPIWRDGDRAWHGALLCLTSAVVTIGGLAWVWSALS